MWFGIGIVIALLCLLIVAWRSSLDTSKMSPRQEAQVTDGPIFAGVLFGILVFFLVMAVVLPK